jgi:hypothetical protein
MHLELPPGVDLTSAEASAASSDAVDRVERSGRDESTDG